MPDKIGQFQARFEIEVPKSHKGRLALSKPFLFVAQWLVGQPIKITAVTEARKPETIVRVGAPRPWVIRPDMGKGMRAFRGMR